MFIPTGLSCSCCQLPVFRPLIGRERQADTAVIELNEGFGYKAETYLRKFWTDNVHICWNPFYFFFKSIFSGEKKRRDRRGEKKTENQSVRLLLWKPGCKRSSQQLDRRLPPAPITQVASPSTRRGRSRSKINAPDKQRRIKEGGLRSPG